MWWKIFYTALKRNGWRQLFFYLSNLDVSRFIEFSETIEFLSGRHELILELGCGYSLLPALLSGSCEQYICLDLSNGACKYQALLPNVSSVVADMQHLPFKTGVITTVLAISSIEHVPDDTLVFKELYRILKKKEGELIISVPYSNNNIEIKIIERSTFLLRILYTYKKFWRIFLGRHLNYFLEQTSIDSFMKYYNMNGLNCLIESNNFTIRRYHIYEKWLQQRLFWIMPKGWFVIKDLIFGWTCWKIEKIFFEKNNNGNGIVIFISNRDND
jgi:SAM-dependent methyltransferase